MKNLMNKFLMLTAVAAVALVSSCGEDEIETPAVAGPSISVTAESTDVAPGDSVKVTVSIEAAGGFDRFTVTEGTTFLSEITAENIDGLETGATSAFNVVVPIAVGDLAVGTELAYTFEVVDALNQTGTAELDVTIVSPDARLYSATTLLAPTGDFENKNFFSVATGEVYSRSVVNATTDTLSADIDFGYFYGSTEGAGLASPLGFESTVFSEQVSGWGTKNATVLKTTALTATAFIETTTYAQVVAAVDAGTADDNGVITGLVAGQVLAFETVGGVKGLIHVSEIAPGFDSDDFIKIDVLSTLEAQ